MEQVDYLGDDYVGSESGDVDYLSGRHPWPYHISFCGDFDITLAPKPQSVYRRVLWGVLPMGILVHGPTTHPELPVPWTPDAFNWNWPMELESWTWAGWEGVAVGVRVFARGCERARLTLNGQELGESHFNLSNLTATFVVPFAPGKLEALCINGSQIVPNISASLTTAGSATKLRLSADRSSLRAGDPNDLSYVTIEVVDSEGVRLPTASVAVNLSLSLSPREWSDARSGTATGRQESQGERTGDGVLGLARDHSSTHSAAAAAAAAAAAVLSIEAVGTFTPVNCPSLCICLSPCVTLILHRPEQVVVTPLTQARSQRAAGRLGEDGRLLCSGPPPWQHLRMPPLSIVARSAPHGRRCR